MDEPLLCVLGSLNLDCLVPVPHLPRPGETVLGGPALRAAGGKGANQAAAAALQGVHTRLLGAAGADEAGDFLLLELAERGVDVSAVLRLPEAGTGRAWISVDPAGENTIVVDPGANAVLAPEHLEHLAESLGEASLLLVQLEIPETTVERALQLAVEAGVPVLLNAAPLPRPLPRAWLERVQALVVNESEARVQAGPGSEDLAPVPLLARLRETGAGEVYLTRGAHGAWRASAHRYLLQEAFPVSARDTTGAGDAFCGVLAAALARGERPAAALRRAAAAGGLAATRPGALPSLPGREEVDALLAEGAAGEA